MKPLNIVDVTGLVVCLAIGGVEVLAINDGVNRSFCLSIDRDKLRDDATRYGNDISALIANRERNAVDNPALIAASLCSWAQEPSSLKDLGLVVFLNLTESILAQEPNSVIEKSVLKLGITNHT